MASVLSFIETLAKMNNTTQEYLKEIGSDSLFIQYLLIFPEYVNFVILFIGIYGMYHGIEIQHPLYTVLFVNLNVACISSAVNIVGFTLIPVHKYVVLSNLTNSQSLYFHCTSWCITSTIRYIYIFHEDWVHNTIASARLKCFLAIMASFGFSCIQSSPVFVVIIYFGNYLLTPETKPRHPPIPPNKVWYLKQTH